MKPRDAVYTEQFEQELGGIEQDFKRADEFIRGAEWVLCRDPEQGRPIDSPPRVWFLPMAGTPTSLPAVLYYTFDDKCVYFLSVRAAAPE